MTTGTRFASVLLGLVLVIAALAYLLPQRELNQTLFQYPEVRTIEYPIDGSCKAFWNRLQYDCEVVRREDVG